MSGSSERRPAVFIIGLVSLLLLWLPPLPYVFRATQIPQPWLEWLISLKSIKFTETWPLRWDYLFVPILSIYILTVLWKSRVSLQEAGLGFQHFGGALKYLWFPTLIGATVLLGIGFLCHSIDITDRFWKRLNPLSGLFQQALIQLFFHRQLVPWFGSGRKTAWILTLFFLALHAPNPGLMAGTLFGMYFWARCYQQHPNLYALALSHALLSALLMHTMPKWILPSVSVGHRFVEKGIAHGWWKWFF